MSIRRQDFTCPTSPSVPAILGRRAAGRSLRNYEADPKSASVIWLTAALATHFLGHRAEICMRLVKRGVAAVLQHRFPFLGFHGRPCSREILVRFQCLHAGIGEEGRHRCRVVLMFICSSFPVINGVTGKNKTCAL